MILGNKTLMCPVGSDQGKMVAHSTPIEISVRLGWNSRGPTVVIGLRCPTCQWYAHKEISLLKMMERKVLCPTNDASTTGSKDS